jgi:hypothetical protein
MAKRIKSPSPRSKTSAAVMKIAEGLSELSEAFEDMSKRGQLPTEFQQLAPRVNVPLIQAVQRFRRITYPDLPSKVVFTS